MAINFKRINTKFLIISLGFIMLGGINNSIQAMDDNYGQENPVDINNNNNIFNTKKLKEKIKFSDFKNFVKSLKYYESADENKKQEIYRKCTNFIKLLPQYIQNNTNNMTSYKICKKQHDEQNAIKDSMISYETCLHYLLDFRRFYILFDRSTANLYSEKDDLLDAFIAYFNFWEILKDYSKNFSIDKHKKILQVIINNCLYCILNSKSFFSSHLRQRIGYHDFVEYNYENFVGMRDVIRFMKEAIGELAKIEYNNDPSMLMPVSTISDKIMNDSIIPSIKEVVFLYYKNKISKIETFYNKSHWDGHKEQIQELKEEFDNVQKNLEYNEEAIHGIKKIIEIDEIVYTETEDLRKEKIMDTFSKKSKMQIKSKHVVSIINSFTKDNRIVQLTKYTRPVAKQEVNINNESEKK